MLRDFDNDLILLALQYIVQQDSNYQQLLNDFQSRERTYIPQFNEPEYFTIQIVYPKVMEHKEQSQK